MAHGILIHFADFNSKSFRNNCPTALIPKRDTKVRAYVLQFVHNLRTWKLLNDCSWMICYLNLRNELRCHAPSSFQYLIFVFILCSFATRYLMSLIFHQYACIKHGMLCDIICNPFPYIIILNHSHYDYFLSFLPISKCTDLIK